MRKLRRIGAIIRSHWFPAFPVLLAGLGSVLYGYREEIERVFIGSSHHYGYVFQGRVVSGESNNKFEGNSIYSARLDICERAGLEGISITVLCYITVKTTSPLTISNSENLTTATYTDGSVAIICCMYFPDNGSIPIYRIKVPRGDIIRKTFPSGKGVRIVLAIPSVDINRRLDSISFSPGEGAPSVLFPIQGNLRDGHALISAKLIKEHRDDPELQRLIQQGRAFDQRLHSTRKMNEGLTYPKE